MSTTFAPEVLGAAKAAARAGGQDTYWRGVGRRLLRDRVTLVCGAILVVMALLIVLAPLIAPYGPTDGSIARRLKPIGTPGYLLGTDELGRDMLSRLLYGGRFSWFVGITPVVLAFFIGGTIGIIAGFAGGKTNMAIMRVTDVFYAFPSVLLAVAVSGSLGAGILNAIMSLTIVFIPPIIRVAESVTTGVRNLDYAEAARATGAGARSIVLVHVLPNVLGPIFIYATSLVGVSMIIASGLSFLGLGIKPPDPEWGLMLNTLRTAIYSQPMIATLPGICIFLTSVCFNFVSDGLRTAMDVRA
ncbi:ABC transporter permease [Propylenella binzhouense]|uniref:ABC transporter permease n=1 Tax=Propylenella binzhouense TaxID=2555902 RepID=A0A964T504_9HYPH|nr:ABC transporter permease [Propylenella binzhouense]MYZ48623.1 ABC transporter permease [Propylenella binzhouense]